VWPKASTPCATAAARRNGCLLLVVDAIVVKTSGFWAGYDGSEIISKVIDD
jgi:hypothetical protein